MQVFKDNANRDWSLSLTIGTAMKVKDQLGVDLLQPEVGEPPLLTRLDIQGVRTYLGQLGRIGI